MEDIGFYETLKRKDIAAIMRNTFRTWDDALFLEYAKTFDLPERKRSKSFPRHEDEAFDCGRPLASSKLLILDEGRQSGLDPIVRSEILDVFLDFIQDESHSILISSHHERSGEGGGLHNVYP